MIDYDPNEPLIDPWALAITLVLGTLFALFCWSHPQ